MMTIEKVRDEKDTYSIENFTQDDMDWVNFSAEKKGQYEPANPNFDLYIPEDFAKELQEKDVYVKIVAPRGEGEVARYAINLKINFKYYTPPEVYIRHNDGSKEYYNADTIAALDRKRFVNGKAMIKLNFSSGKQGTCYVNILELKEKVNPFDLQWAEEESPEEDGLPF